MPQPPKTRVTSFQVAKAAGVSRTTVSLVLNNAPGANIPAETRRRVFEAARALNYVPDANARRLVTGLSKTIALAIHRPAANAFANAYLSNTLSGIARIAQAQGFRIMLELTEHEEDTHRLYQLLRSGAVDGLICEDWMTEADLLAAGFTPDDPIVLLSEAPLQQFSHVSVNLCEAQRLIVDAALALGHRDFACVTYTALGSSASQDRRFADLQAQLAGAGAPLAAEQVICGDMSIDGALDAAGRMLDAGRRPSVIFGMNDTMAIGAARAAKARGTLIPDQISVIGFEGQDLTRLVTPQINTVAIPWRRKGEIAIDMLIARLLSGDNSVTFRALEPSLVSGGSLSRPDR